MNDDLSPAVRRIGAFVIAAMVVLPLLGWLLWPAAVAGVRVVLG